MERCRFNFDDYPGFANHEGLNGNGRCASHESKADFSLGIGCKLETRKNDLERQRLTVLSASHDPAIRRITLHRSKDVLSKTKPESGVNQSNSQLRIDIYFGCDLAEPVLPQDDCESVQAGQRQLQFILEGKRESNGSNIHTANNVEVCQPDAV